jgi:hypothetical protein
MCCATWHVAHTACWGPKGKHMYSSLNVLTSRVEGLGPFAYSAEKSQGIEGSTGQEALRWWGLHEVGRVCRSEC